MAATVKIYQQTATSTTTNVDSADGTDPKFGTDDAVQSSTAIAIPSSTGTKYSCPKAFFINVTTGDSTSISNRQIKLSAAPSDSGLKLFFKDLATYATQSALADSASDGPATPAGYTALTTSYQSWDTGSDSAASTGRSGDYVAVVVGVDSSFAAGGGSFTNPDLSCQYDES